MRGWWTPGCRGGLRLASTEWTRSLVPRGQVARNCRSRAGERSADGGAVDAVLADEDEGVGEDVEGDGESSAAAAKLARDLGATVTNRPAATTDART